MTSALALIESDSGLFKYSVCAPVDVDAAVSAVDVDAADVAAAAVFPLLC